MYIYHVCNISSKQPFFDSRTISEMKGVRGGNPIRICVLCILNATKARKRGKISANFQQGGHKDCFHLKPTKKI